MLESAAALYARGAELRWDRVVGGGTRRLELPTYPFQRKRYWATPSAASHAPPAAQAPQAPDVLAHPLLGGRLQSAALTASVFESRLSIDRLPFLADHRVFGAAVLPATAYLEMAV